MTDAEFYRKLHEELGVRLPGRNERDWVFCAGNAFFTEDYIHFYQQESLTALQKKLLMCMIVQGIEDLCRIHFSDGAIQRLWKKVLPLLLKDDHFRIVRDWSCIGQPLEHSFYVTGRMRQVLPYWMGVCEECGSRYLKPVSGMKALCPECASVLYGCPPCEHIFENGICTECMWDGRKTPYMTKIQEEQEETKL